LVFTLAPLHQQFGIRRVLMVSMQSCSGAGRSPGVSALDIVDNIVPYIPKEEEKVSIETLKILGSFDGHSIQPATFSVSSTCTRVPVLEGHTEAVFIELAQAVSEEEIKNAWHGFAKEFTARQLPSSPRNLLDVHSDPFRPQPRLDRDNQDGMTTSIGRLRQDNSVENGWKYMLVSHNTKMGAAKGCLLVAEYLHQEGVF